MLVPCRVTNIPMFIRSLEVWLQFYVWSKTSRKEKVQVYIFSVGRLPNLVLNAPINMASLQPVIISAFLKPHESLKFKNASTGTALKGKR